MVGKLNGSDVNLDNCQSQDTATRCCWCCLLLLQLRFVNLEFWCAVMRWSHYQPAYSALLCCVPFLWVLLDKIVLVSIILIMRRLAIGCESAEFEPFEDCIG